MFWLTLDVDFKDDLRFNVGIKRQMISLGLDDCLSDKNIRGQSTKILFANAV